MSTIFNDNRKLTSFLAVAAVLLVVFVVADCARDRKRESEISGLQDVIKAERSKVEIWKNKEGKSRARAEVAEGDRKILADAYAEEFRMMRKEFDIKEKNFRSATMISTKTEGKISVVTKDSLIYIDTAKVKARVFSFRDRWATINGHFLRDSLSLNYKFYDSLTIATSWKPKEFFKPKTWFADRELRIDAVSENPNTSITGLRSLSVRNPKRSRIGIGPFVGYSLSGPTIGIGIHFDLIQF